MTETNDWNTAPKDGSEINVRFPDGTLAKAKWNAKTDQWDVPRRGKWASMRDVHGGRVPVVARTAHCASTSSFVLTSRLPCTQTSNTTSVDCRGKVAIRLAARG
jgi:hypothetical protein